MWSWVSWNSIVDVPVRIFRLSLEGGELGHPVFLYTIGFVLRTLRKGAGVRSCYGLFFCFFLRWGANLHFQEKERKKTFFLRSRRPPQTLDVTLYLTRPPFAFSNLFTSCFSSPPHPKKPTYYVHLAPTTEVEVLDTCLDAKFSLSRLLAEASRGGLFRDPAEKQQPECRQAQGESVFAGEWERFPHPPNPICGLAWAWKGRPPPLRIIAVVKWGRGQNGLLSGRRMLSRNKLCSTRRGRNSHAARGRGGRQSSRWIFSPWFPTFGVRRDENRGPSSTKKRGRERTKESRLYTHKKVLLPGTRPFGTRLRHNDVVGKKKQ